MSYIDTFDNEFVGYFGGIPVYHPLVDVPDTPDCPEDFGCGPGHLVIGGGPGEHPGIVLVRPGEAVLGFVRTWLDEYEQLYPDDYQALKPTVAALPDVARWEWPFFWGHVLRFAGWQVMHYVKFHDRCRSPAFNRPFDPDRDGSLEAWLAASLGEFILLALPELCLDLVDQLGELRGHAGRCPLYENVLLLPSGYRVWGRRETEGRVVWGQSAWRVERVPNS